MTDAEIIHHLPTYAPEQFSGITPAEWCQPFRAIFVSRIEANKGTFDILEMAKRLISCVRADDTVARLGGDEFSIVLSELRRPEDAGRVAEKILSVVQRPLTIGSVPVEVSASIGIAVLPASSMSNSTG